MFEKTYWEEIINQLLNILRGNNKPAAKLVETIENNCDISVWKEYDWRSVLSVYF